MEDRSANRAKLDEDDASARVPYRHPQPKDAFAEIVIPYAVPEDERQECLVSAFVPLG